MIWKENIIEIFKNWSQSERELPKFAQKRGHKRNGDREGTGHKSEKAKMSRERAWELAKWTLWTPVWVKLPYTWRHVYVNLIENSRATFPEVLVIGYVLIRTCPLCWLFCFIFFFFFWYLVWGWLDLLLLSGMFYPHRTVLTITLNYRKGFPANFSHPLRFPSNILPQFISQKREAKEQTDSCPPVSCQMCLLHISSA